MFLTTHKKLPKHWTVKFLKLQLVSKEEAPKGEEYVAVWFQAVTKDSGNISCGEFF